MTDTESAINQAALDALRELQDEDDPEMLKDLITMFLDTTPGRMSQLREAITSAKTKDLTLAAHSLKSACANLGALTMSRLCEQLERLGQSGTCSGAAELLTSLDAEYKRAKAELLASI